jgi:DNA modification methylase
LVAKKGAIVFDPFGGSGTTAVSCIEEGVGFLIIEREADYIPTIQARVKEAYKQNKFIQQEIVFSAK